MPMNDGVPISIGEREIANLLGAWGKAETPANRDLLAAEAKVFTGDPAWGPHTWERFYQYVEIRQIKELMADKGGSSTVLRESDTDDHPFTVIQGWGPPKPKMPAPPGSRFRETSAPLPGEKSTITPAPKQEPLPEDKPKTPPPIIPAHPVQPSTFIYEPKAAPTPQPKQQASPPPPAAPPKQPAAPLPPGKPVTTPPEEPVKTKLPESSQTVMETAPLAEKPKRSRVVPVLLVVLGLLAAAVLLVVLLLRQPTGVAIATPAPSAATESPTASVAPTQAAIDTAAAEKLALAVKENSPVMFVADEETWIPGEEAKLDRIGATLTGLKKVALMVTGHTADDNKPNAQMALSIARAEAVKAYLLQQQGDTMLTITATGKGATEPKVTGVSVGDQGPNRRVEIKLNSAE